MSCFSLRLAIPECKTPFFAKTMLVRLQLSTGPDRIVRHPRTCGTGLLMKADTYRRLGPLLAAETTCIGCTWHDTATLTDSTTRSYTRNTWTTRVQPIRNTIPAVFNVNRHRHILDKFLDDPFEVRYYTHWLHRLRRRIQRYVALRARSLYRR